MPVVSIVVPAYNAEKTILETIQSIQAQTFADFELIVINDGSTDRTLEILSTVEDPRLKVFSYENGGLPVARNRGIQQSTGQFISFIDADDLWTADKLEAQLTALEQHPKAGVAYSWTSFIDENSQFLYTRDPLPYTGDVYPRLLIENFISSGSNILVRRALIEAAGEFDPALKSAEDWDYYLRLAARAEFVLVPQYQILYRRSSQSMTSKVDVMEQYILTVTERAFAAAPEHLQFLKNQSLSRTYRFLAQLCLAHVLNDEGSKQARHRLRKAIALYPKTLLERRTQRLLLKALLTRFLPYSLATRFSRKLGKAFPDPSTQNLPLANQD